GKYAAKAVPVGTDLRVTVDVDGVRQLAASLRLRVGLLQERAELLKKAKAEDKALEAQLKEATERRDVAVAMEKKLKGGKVAERYARREATPLQTSVKTGSQTFDIRLRKEPQPRGKKKEQ